MKDDAAERAARAPQSPPSIPAARPPDDRRDPKQQHPIPGGARATDPPLTTRMCADWMGYSTAFVRDAIDVGVVVRGRLVKLEAETLELNGRKHRRIHLDRFIAFLVAIHWKRIPRSTHSRQQTHQN